MARTATKPTDENMINVSTEAEMNEENIKTTKKTIKEEPLKDSDEIEVISLIPNVSYKDSKTLDMYEWYNAGHIELMTFDILKNMWRSHKGYFKNLWLKPNDDRVIKAFGLNKTFEKYEYLMDGSNYTKKNIETICDAINSTPNGLKFAICDKVKNLVIGSEVTDVFVIRELEKRLQIDLMVFLG
jgi:hypothetical protein